MRHAFGACRDQGSNGAGPSGRRPSVGQDMHARFSGHFGACGLGPHGQRGRRPFCGHCRLPREPVRLPEAHFCKFVWGFAGRQSDARQSVIHYCNSAVGASSLSPSPTGFLGNVAWAELRRPYCGRFGKALCPPHRRRVTSAITGSALLLDVGQRGQPFACCWGMSGHNRMSMAPRLKTMFLMFK